MPLSRNTVSHKRNSASYNFEDWLSIYLQEIGKPAEAIWGLSDNTQDKAVDFLHNHSGDYRNDPNLRQSPLVDDSGYSVDFDGSSHYVEIPDHENLDIDGNTPFTMGVWIKISSDANTGNVHEVLTKGEYSDGDGLWAMYISNDGLAWIEEDPSNDKFSEYGVINAGTKYFLTIVGQSDGIVRFYIDASQVNTDDFSNIDDLSTSKPVNIGRRGADGYNFDGQIDTPFITFNELTSNEITRIHNVAQDRTNASLVSSGRQDV